MNESIKENSQDTAENAGKIPNQENMPGSAADEKAKNQAEYRKIRAQFDKLLNKHILRLIEIDTESGLKFDTATVASLVLLVEKEKEIKSAPKAPPKRYTQDSFFNELSEIGLLVDDELFESFQRIVKAGYVGIDEKNEEYSARVASLALVKFIDNLFSGMPGLNLIAYICQCIDEITSGRKTLKENLVNFEQTLVSRGVAISDQNIKEEEKETIKKTAVTFKVTKESMEAAAELKKVRLASLRTRVTKNTGARPEYKQPVKVRELYHKEDSAEKAEARKKAEEEAKNAALELERKEAEIRKREEELKRAEEQAQALEKQKAEMAAREEEIRRAEVAAREAEVAAKEAELKKAELAAKEAEMAAREKELAAQAAAIEKAKEEDAQAHVEAEASESKEGALSVEDQIALFEQELAIPCPICSIGKIITSQTEKNKEYYSCSNEVCKFVSWSKPYHFECPLCKTPYLIEVTGADGTKGLKCPRAACSFSQSGIHHPAAAPQTPATDAPKKKKKIVRRKKK